MQPKLGMFAATAAFIIWGSSPIYWKELWMIAPSEVISHRMMWSLLVTAILVVIKGRRKHIVAAFKQPKHLISLFCTAVLMAGNWFLYIWAVNNGYILESSLGYFINPLLNVACGFMIFGEVMRRGQWLAIFVAFCAVLYLTVWYGQFPWIALALGCSFAIYGVIHKKTSLPALDALFVETVVLFIPSVVYLIWREANGLGGFFTNGPMVSFLLMATGIVTTLPLLFFGVAAHNLRLSTIGIFQYIAPSLSLIIGIFLYHEEFPIQRFLGFAIIWLAIALYLLEGHWNRRKQDRIILGRK